MNVGGGEQFWDIVNSLVDVVIKMRKRKQVRWVDEQGNGVSNYTDERGGGGHGEAGSENVEEEQGNEVAYSLWDDDKDYVFDPEKTLNKSKWQLKFENNNSCFVIVESEIAAEQINVNELALFILNRTFNQVLNCSGKNRQEFIIYIKNSENYSLQLIEEKQISASYNHKAKFNVLGITESNSATSP